MNHYKELNQTSVKKTVLNLNFGILSSNVQNTTITHREESTAVYLFTFDHNSKPQGHPSGQRRHHLSGNDDVTCSLNEHLQLIT